MLKQIEIILNNLLQFGIYPDGLEELGNIAIGNEGIFGIISDKRDQIVNSGDSIQIVSLLQLITAINVTMDVVDGKPDFEQIQELIIDNQSKNLRKVNNQLELKLNDLIELSSDEMVVKLANRGWNDTGYGEDQFWGDKKIYKQLVARYLKATNDRDLQSLTLAINTYGADIANYILENHDFSDFKKSSGMLLVMSAKYHPQLASEICFDLLKLDVKTDFKKYLYASLGYNSENSQFLYDTAIAYCGEKSVEKLNNKGVFIGLYVGLFLIQDDNFKAFYEHLNGEGTFKCLYQVEREIVENYKLTGERGILKQILYHYNEINPYSIPHDWNDYFGDVGKLKTLSWEEKIEVFLSPSICELSDALKYTLLHTIGQTRERYLTKILKYLDSGWKIDCIYLYNQQVFETDSLELKILAHLWNEFTRIKRWAPQKKNDRIDNIAKFVHLETLRENIKLLPSQQIPVNLTAQTSNNVVSISNQVLRREINYHLKKLYLESEIKQSELNQLKKLTFQLSGLELEGNVIEQLVNVKSVIIKCSDIKAFDKISGLQTLNNLSLIDYEGTFDLEALNGLKHLETLKICLSKASNIESVKDAIYKHNLKSLVLDKFDYQSHFGLLELFPQLEELSIISLTNYLSVDQYRSIMNLKQLKRFELGDDQIEIDLETKTAIKLTSRSRQETYASLIATALPNLREFEILNTWADDTFEVIEYFKSLLKIKVRAGQNFPFIFDEIATKPLYKQLIDFDVSTPHYHIKAVNYQQTNQLEYVKIMGHALNYDVVVERLKAIRAYKIKVFKFELQSYSTTNLNVETLERYLELIKKLDIEAELEFKLDSTHIRRNEFKQIVEHSLAEWNKTIVMEII